MVKQTAEDGPKDAGVSIRTTKAFRDRLTVAAKQNGRSLAQEVERRLEASFEDQADVRAAPNPLADLISSEVEDYLKTNRSAADLLSTFAAIMRTTNRISRDRGFSELEAREALRVAWGVVEFFHLNMGEESTPKLKGPAPAPGIKRAELPPRFLGHEVAMSHVQNDMLWKDQPVPSDTIVARIRDYWSGDGSKLVLGASEEEVAAAEKVAHDAARRALQSGDIQFEKPENLHKYKPTWTFEVDDAPAPMTPLKDILGER